MTGKVIDSSANNLLILILPIAFLIVLLFKAWPALLALLIFSICFQVWQQYQWKQWSKQVNPYFNQLIKENQGCLTVLDLTMKAGISAPAATRYLDKRAEEFGAQRQDYEGKGTVYYFLTASALGSMFEESEPTVEPEDESLGSQRPKLMELLSQKVSSPPQSESSPSELIESPEPSAEKELQPLESPEPPAEKEPQPVESPAEKEPQPLETTPPADEVKADPKPVEQTEPASEKEDLWADTPDNEQQDSQSLIQAELAKRLDVHSSTVGKRKSDPDFSEWSQSRDPEGIAWKYSPKAKEFVPLEKKP
ncbi:MAG: hypothetical protein KME25_08460 [Symplocastrum torsivum CPER-KK1]|jgi:hypothetical protein|uniref:Uncharacterized protein n=1 Tax=Symplocastrum torsivum CPER-KK1 TaxID=450513 RepID=A0A951PIE7_9CYAN|nr:hypothetical protein [Symplocastrum torsivum CPER-KK1]